MTFTIVWFLTGLWHGANWTFIIWGMMYFILLSFEKMINFDEKVKSKIIKRLYTLFFVQMGWLIFRSPNLAQAIAYIKTMMYAGADVPMIDHHTIRYFAEHKTFFLFAFIFSMPVGKWISNLFKTRKTVIAEISHSLVYIVLFVVAVSYIVKGSYNPFIYFNF